MSPCSTHPLSRRRRLASLLAGIAMVASACGSGQDGAAESGADLAFSDEDSPSSTPLDTKSLDTNSADDEDTRAEFDEATRVPELGLSGDPGDGTTSGSGLPPVVATEPDPGGDPDNLYRGTIGGLEPDQILVPGAAAPPVPDLDAQPLTGRPGPVPERPAAVVKVDNGSAAAPHTGLNRADIVVEEEVEGGVTRFAAIFHSTPSIVGPVRSGRTTDVAIISSLGDPVLLYSGANHVTQGVLADQPGLRLRTPGWSSGFWRDDSRRAPSNLYTDTAPHWASADGGPPPAQFHYRDKGESAAGAAVSELAVAYPSSVARWVWDDSSWQRWQRGDEHLLVGGEQVSAANVVVVEAEEVDTGLVDASGGAVPEFVFVGTGRATVFTDGRRIEGTWTRPALNSVATLTEGPGRPIELTPGRTWIQLVEAGSNALSYS